MGDVRFVAQAMYKGSEGVRGMGFDAVDAFAKVSFPTSLRGEGTEESNGSYALKRAPGALTSISQFSTQRIRPDPNNPSTFIVRAICLLGTEGSR